MSAGETPGQARPFGAAPAAPPPATLTLRAHAPATVSGTASRDISVTVARAAEARIGGDALVRRHWQPALRSARPAAHPPLRRRHPWDGARELAPGATSTVVFSDASDKRGVWRLPPGRYRVVPVYDVPVDLAPPAVITDPGRVWRGHLEGSPVWMTVN